MVWRLNLNMFTYHFNRRDSLGCLYLLSLLRRMVVFKRDYRMPWTSEMRTWTGDETCHFSIWSIILWENLRRVQIKSKKTMSVENVSVWLFFRGVRHVTSSLVKILGLRSRPEYRLFHPDISITRSNLHELAALMWILCMCYCRWGTHASDTIT